MHRHQNCTLVTLFAAHHCLAVGFFLTESVLVVDIACIILLHCTSPCQQHEVTQWGGDVAPPPSSDLLWVQQSGNIPPASFLQGVTSNANYKRSKVACCPQILKLQQKKVKIPIKREFSFSFFHLCMLISGSAEKRLDWWQHKSSSSFSSSSPLYHAFLVLVPFRPPQNHSPAHSQLTNPFLETQFPASSSHFSLWRRRNEERKSLTAF